MPFGEPRGTQPTWLGTKGYVGGTKDDTGLTHLGAREYDPTTGRFISVDPIMDLTDPQQWNAYTYSNNSPITASDPDGRVLQWLMDGGGGGPGVGSALTIGVSSANIAALSIVVTVVTTAIDNIEDQLRDDERDAQNKTGIFKIGEPDRDGKSIWSDGSIRDKTGKIIYAAGTLDMSGPGQWMFKNEGMSDDSKNWQSTVTGAPRGLVYRLGDKNYDGYRDGSLYDAKGNYAFMIKDGDWGPKFRHMKDYFLDEARKQTNNSHGLPIIWVFLQPEVRAVVERQVHGAGFTNIQFASPTL